MHSIVIISLTFGMTRKDCPSFKGKKKPAKNVVVLIGQILWITLGVERISLILNQNLPCQYKFDKTVFIFILIIDTSLIFYPKTY